MVWRGRSALLGIPILLLVLVGCGPQPDPRPTPKTVGAACADLEDAVRAFYDIASPNSTLTELDVRNLPEVNGFKIPQPSCSFEVRPDPAVVPGNVFTIENFYVEYDETLTLTLQEGLKAAGFKKRDPEFMNWAISKLGRYYSASLLVYLEGDGTAYSEAAEHRLLDLSIGQG